MDLWTSDTHFNHANILHLGSGRPFPDIDTMNRIMIERWNARVNKSDTVYHLGDFAMGNRALVPEIRAKLNGRIVMVLGNHDKPRGWDQLFDHVCKRYELETRYGKILMRHAPNNLDPWSQGSRDEIGGEEGFDYFLHGHVHHRWARRGVFINVGVDVRDYEPKTIDELLDDQTVDYREEVTP